LAALFLCAGTFAANGSCPPAVHQATTTRPFEDVIDDLELAITERNFRITGRNTIGKGIRQRGYPRFPGVEVIHFCSLELAREVLELDPGFIVHMPCRVTVHEQGGNVIVTAILLPEAHRLPGVTAFARKMNGVLREIVDSALAE
jgi:uncharacterized protein (DUF302 family)